MGNQVGPVEPVSGKSGTNRALPFLETPSLRLQRQQADTRPVEEAKEARDARGDETREARPQPAGSLPKDRVELGSKLTQTQVQFTYDEEAQIIQTKVIESGTNRVIREIPPKALIELAKSLRAYQEAGRASRAARQHDGPGGDPVDQNGQNGSVKTE